jgi:cell division protein FtsW
MRLTRARSADSLPGRRHKPDYMLVLLAAILLAVGFIVVYAISPGLAAQKNVSENYYVGKQLLAILLGIIAFVAMSQINVGFWRRIQWPLVGIAAAASLAVLVVGEKVNGAYRWIQIGGLSFQPVELIKFTVIVWLAGFLATQARLRLLNDFKKTIKPFFIALLFVAIVVAKLQSDLGSAGVIVAIMLAMAFVAGLPLKRVASIGLVVAVGGVLLISTSAYRRDRMLTFLNPQRDCQGSGYQTCQALIAVGSGGLMGRGIASSGQAFGYLPEAANDSIFAIMAEKFGFIGMGFVIFLLVALFSRIRRVLERSLDNYARLLTAGVLAWLSTQSIINIGAMLGLLPLKGITLPFISYGGTSVVFVAGAVGLVFNISRYTTFRISNPEGERNERESAVDWRGNRRPYYAAADRRP